MGWEVLPFTHQDLWGVRSPQGTVERGTALLAAGLFPAEYSG